LDAGRCSREEEGERRDGCPPIDDSSVSKLLKAAVPEGTSRGGEPHRRGGDAAEGLPGGEEPRQRASPEGRRHSGGSPPKGGTASAGRAGGETQRGAAL